MIPAIDAFYFRLLNTNIYYTETNEDLVVLGAIAISNIVSVDENENDNGCFAI